MCASFINIMFLDVPPYSHSKKGYDPKMKQKIIKGAKIGDEIKKMRENHHKEYELPEAEKNLDAEIASIDDGNKEKEVQNEIKPKLKKSVFQKISTFFKKVFTKPQ